MRAAARLLLALAATLALTHGTASSAGTAWTSATLKTDTLAVGFMDSTKVVDMSNFRLATIHVKIDPPAGAAEPWFVVRIRAIGVFSATGIAVDSTSTSILQFQPVADHTYLAAVAGDSLAYGAWTTGSAAVVGNGEILVRGARPNSKWPYPHTWSFSLANKGQEVPVRYWYLQLMGESGSGSVGRYTISYTLRD